VTSSIYTSADFRFLRQIPLEGVDNPKSSRFSFYNTNSICTCVSEVQAFFAAMTLAASKREYENLYQGDFKTNLYSADETIAVDVAHYRAYSRLI
jgi:PDZ domain-containing secreted protein